MTEQNTNSFQPGEHAMRQERAGRWITRIVAGPLTAQERQIFAAGWAATDRSQACEALLALAVANNRVAFLQNQEVADTGPALPHVRAVPGHNEMIQDQFIRCDAEELAFFAGQLGLASPLLAAL